MKFIACLLTLLLQTSSAPTASIEGLVLRAGTREPVAGVEITLRRVGGGATDGNISMRISSLATHTGRDGKFAFNGLDAGSYRVTAARNGYVKQEYGQRTHGGQGISVDLAARQELKDITFDLTPTGNLEGRVSNEAGDAVTGMHVQILRSVYSANGTRTLRTVASARTNDRGEYRLYWITPGRYYLNVGSGNPDQRSEGSSANEVAVRQYPTTFYPGTLDPSKATIVEILPGTELSAIDFVLPEQPMHAIRGTVIDATTGKPPPLNVELSIEPRQPDAAFGFSILNRSYNPANGNFEFRNVPPGSYWIRGTVEPGPDTPIAPSAAINTVADVFARLLSSIPGARLAVDIVGSDVENVMLTLAPGIRVQGTVAIEGQELSTLEQFRDIHVELVPTTSNQYEGLPRPLPEDGRFTLDNVPLGEYRVEVRHPQPDTYVKEARFDSVDVLNQPVVISDASASGMLNIVLSPRAGRIDGTSLDRESRPMANIQAVLIPEHSRERVDLYRTAISDRDGRFSMRGIPPGDYKLFAWEAIEEFAYFDSDFLRQFEQQGKRVSISEGSTVTTDVRVIQN